MNFLKKSATQIWRQYQNSISEHLFLFPSRRSMLYFKRALTEAAGRHLWVPDCLTLDQWILDQSTLIPADSITSSHQLFQAARQVNFVDYGFELFYPMAQVILNDFDEVDMALINPEELWGNTSAWQNTPDHPQSRVWSEMKDTALKKRWEVNWNKLQKLYEIFGQNLESRGLSTKGRIYRNLLDNHGIFDQLSYPRVHVIGFSSLRKAEKRLFQRLQSDHSVSFYWNNIPGMNAPGLDAGEQVQPWSQLYGQELKDYNPPAPEVEIVSAPGMVGQMKMVSQLLEELNGPEEQMAVVLPHPSLIDLLLESFPENRSLVNISMGFPLVYSPARSMIDWVLSLWESSISQNGRIKSAEIELVWSHLYFTTYLSAKNIDPSLPSQLYFEPEDLYRGDPLTKLLFTPMNSPIEALNRLIDICGEITPVQNKLFHREVIRFVKGRLVRFHDVLSGIEGISFGFLKRILMEMMQESSIPFRGEPMQGVQVLGLQEVQNLSFDTLIVPGMNEEILPTGKIKSMIPFSLRRYYDLEDLSGKHSTQSYYLWSAMLQARKVFLINSQGPDYLGAKGLSRYIFQLKYGGLDVSVSERYIDLDLSGFEPANKEIYLTEAHRRRLKEYLQQEGLSATAVLSYVTCPFQFFLRYILRLREDDVAVAGLDYRQMGSAIHNVMHRLYEPWKGRTISPEDFDQIHASIPSVTKEAYAALYPRDAPDVLGQGVHWVEQEVITQAVHRIVEVDREMEKLSIEILEDDREVYLDAGRIQNVRLRGKIDRVDLLDGVYRIIDYKTGSSKFNKSSIEKNWANRTPVHNWQLFFYAYLMKDVLSAQQFEMGHYTLKDKKLYAPMVIGTKINYDGNDLTKFEEVLVEMIDTMADPEIPYEQTTNTAHCKYCVFNTFCERQACR